MLKTHPGQMVNLIKRLERNFQPGVKDAGASVAASLVERFANRRTWAARTSPGRRRGHDITNLVQEALEEEAADKRLTHMVVALGLLMASLDSPPRK